MVLDPIAPWRLDGITMTDQRGRPRLDPVDETNEAVRAQTWTLGNTKRATSKSGTVHGIHGPTGAPRKTWTVNLATVDPVLRKTVERLCARDKLHLLASKLPVAVGFDGGPNPVEPTNMTEAYLDRYALASTHVASGGEATQPGGGTATMLEVWDEVAGSALSLVYHRSVEVTDNATVGAGATIVVTAYDWLGAVLETDTLTEGVEWAIGGTAALTATSIAAALNALTTVVSAATGAEARYYKASTAVVVLKVTTASPGLTVRPSAGQVALDVSSTGFRYRNLKFGTAPSDKAGAVTVYGHFVYRVTVEITSTRLAGYVATENVGMALIIRDQGIAGLDPLGAP